MNCVVEETIYQAGVILAVATVAAAGVVPTGDIEGNRARTVHDCYRQPQQHRGGYRQRQTFDIPGINHQSSSAAQGCIYTTSFDVFMWHCEVAASYRESALQYATTLNNLEVKNF